MLIAAFIVLGSSLALVTLSLFVMAFAPQGYEDETGFHMGPKQSSRPELGHAVTFSEAKATA